jgi:hypothetical protein
MFCPVCRTEYRPGFTRCADCDVDLVAQLPDGDPAADADSNEDIPTNSDGLELLWSGVSQALSDRIHDELDAAHILNRITEREFGLLPNFTQSAKFVWVSPHDRTASRSIRDKILADKGSMEQQDELTPPDAARINPLGLDRRVYNFNRESTGAPFETEDALLGSDEPDEPVADDIVEDFDPDDATREVWSGDDHEMADYLKLCLSGVGIGCVVLEDRGKTRVRVLPATEIRAREIVREILEGTPPQ